VGGGASYLSYGKEKGEYFPARGQDREGKEKRGRETEARGFLPLLIREKKIILKERYSYGKKGENMVSKEGKSLSFGKEKKIRLLSGPS